MALIALLALSLVRLVSQGLLVHLVSIVVIIWSIIPALYAMRIASLVMIVAAVNAYKGIILAVYSVWPVLFLVPLVLHQLVALLVELAIIYGIMLVFCALLLAKPVSIIQPVPNALQECTL